MTKVVYNEDIHTLAKEIISSKNKVADYIKDCMTAEICPKCGDSLKKTTETVQILFESTPIVCDRYVCKSCSSTYTTSGIELENED